MSGSARPPSQATSQILVSLRLAWSQWWGPWRSPEHVRAFPTCPTVVKLVDRPDGVERVCDPAVAVRIWSELSERTEIAHRQRIEELVADKERAVADAAVALDCAAETEARLLEREAQLLARREELLEDLERERRLLVRFHQLAEEPTALCWLRGLRTLVRTAQHVQSHRAAPDELSDPVGAAMSRHCSIGRVAVALDVPVSTVQRIRPGTLPLGDELARIEENYRGVLLRGLLAHGELDEDAFETPKEPLKLHTAGGPDAGMVQYRSAYSKPHK